MFVLGCFCAIFLLSRDLGSVSSQLFPFLSSSLFPDEAQRLSALHRLPGTISHFSTEKFIKEESKQLLINKNEPKNSQMESLYPLFRTAIPSILTASHHFWTLMNQWQSQKTFSPLLVDQVKLKGHKRFNQTFEIGFSSVPPQTLADKGLELKPIW